MIFRQLFDATSSTYTYILGCEETLQAIVIDPVFEQHLRDTALIRELGLTVLTTIDTHVHADHVTGAWLMKQRFGSNIALSGECQAAGVDVALKDGDQIGFGHRHVVAHATPGHTNGCMTLVTDDQTMAFTGDTLLIRGAGRTDFQAGDVHTMWTSIREKIFTLPDSCLIYPAHDYMGRMVSSVAEEKAHNPRIGGDAREEDFSGYMNNLGLPHPKQLEIALPANMKCGEPDEPLATPDWAPITITFAGIPEVEPEWVASHAAELLILDVRSEAEFQIEHIEGATLIPIDELRERVTELPKNKPVVSICQSGKRSAMAVQILKSHGFTDIANIPGGMINWSRLALPVWSHYES